jgi:hypothetical protein
VCREGGLRCGDVRLGCGNGGGSVKLIIPWPLGYVVHNNYNTMRFMISSFVHFSIIYIPQTSQ